MRLHSQHNHTKICKVLFCEFPNLHSVKLSIYGRTSWFLRLKYAAKIILYANIFSKIANSNKIASSQFIDFFSWKSLYIDILIYQRIQSWQIFHMGTSIILGLFYSCDMSSYSSSYYYSRYSTYHYMKDENPA